MEKTQSSYIQFNPQPRQVSQHTPDACIHCILFIIIIRGDVGAVIRGTARGRRVEMRGGGWRSSMCGGRGLTTLERDKAGGAFRGQGRVWGLGEG